MKQALLTLVAFLICICMLVSCNAGTSDSETGTNESREDIENATEDNGDANDSGNDGSDSNETDDSGDNGNDSNETDDSGDNGNDSNETENQPPDNANKFNGSILKSTPFSEGLAIVSDGTRTCCIDKTGSIIFELDVPFDTTSGGFYTQGFQHGYVKIGTALYDKTGKVTTPEDVGVTALYDYALSGGYIIAYKEEATYNSTTQALGVMDTEFNWIIPLSEELYQNARKLTDPYVSTYAIDGYIINHGTYVFEISTSTYYEFDDAPEALGEHGWTPYTDGSFCKGDGTVVFTVEGSRAQGKWVNGQHIVSFYNQTANKNFFTLVDTTGSFAFEPVEMPLPHDIVWGHNWAYDGRYIVVSNAVGEGPLYVYDTVEKTGRLSDIKTGGKYILNDGVLTVYDVKMDLYSGTTSSICYYDLDFNPLF